MVDCGVRSFSLKPKVGLCAGGPKTSLLLPLPAGTPEVPVDDPAGMRLLVRQTCGCRGVRKGVHRERSGDPLQRGRCWRVLQ